MKNLSLFVLLFSPFLFSQNFVGTWNGVLAVQGMQMHLNFNISKTENGFVTTMDSPDQGAKGIPVTKTTVNNNTLLLEIPAGKINYSGTLKNDVISGTFTQNGQEFQMNLSKASESSQALKRPQEPTKPFPHLEEEVVFENKNKDKLSGTLTLPSKMGSFPAVILISGSGPQNRDEELLGHKPFLVLSDFLTRHGIAVLRYDDRGIGQSKGNFSKATSVDFADDVESAVSFLKTRSEINASKIGLIGHSEGGLIAPMVASKNSKIKFLVLLAGPAMKGSALLLLQKEKIERAMGISEGEIEKGQKTFFELYEKLNKKHEESTLKLFLKSKLDAKTADAEIDGILRQLESPWMQFYLNYDPKTALEKTNCAVLALNGENDLQVPFKGNLDIIKNTLNIAKNKNVTTKSYPKLNHLFQTCETGSPAEYGLIEETFSEKTMQDLSDWILKEIK